MAMSSTRRLYEELEQQTLRLDQAADEELADRIRDLMDFVWYKRLSAEDRGALNARGAVEYDWLFEPAILTPHYQLEPIRGEVPYLQ